MALKNQNLLPTYLSGASAYLRIQLRLCPVEIEQGCVRAETFKRWVQSENAYLVVGYYEDYCCTTLSFMHSDKS